MVAPVAPSDPASVGAPAAGVGITWAKVSWLPATDDVALGRYEIRLDGRTVASAPATATSATLTGLRPSTTYELGLRAVDGSGNRTTYPASATFTTLPAVVMDPLPY